LLGFASTTTSASRVSSSASAGNSRTAWPAWRQAWACSAYIGASSATRPGGRRRGSILMAACEPATGSRVAQS
jgi:hypothetical protein